MAVQAWDAGDDRSADGMRDISLRLESLIRLPGRMPLPAAPESSVRIELVRIEPVRISSPRIGLPSLGSLMI
jgi:hypothetical protein